MKYILTHHGFYNATDEYIMKHGKMFGGIYILYGSDSYNKEVSRVNEIFGWIKEDYPDIKEDDVEIHVFTSSNSDWIAHTLALRFVVTAEEFIRLRNAKMIRHF